MSRKDLFSKYDKNLSKYLKIVRKAHDLSQADAGSIVGVSYQQWQKYEKGINRISASSLLTFLNELNLLKNADLRKIVS